MTTQATAKSVNANAAPATPTWTVALQRKCACGGSASSLTGSCADCDQKNRLQTKLAIGASNDPLEQEADRVADQVLAAPAHSNVASAPPRIQRFTAHASGDVGSAPASVDQALASSGNSLEPALRQDMEQRFGHDFSRVRVHADAAAEQSARDVNAHAYTVGHDVVFAAGQYAPQSAAGHRLLAHELTHVVQQEGGAAPVLSRKSADSEFGEPALQSYLRFIDGHGIEDNSDSDDKARAIVNTWKFGGSPYVLTARRKALLIKEMQSGVTGDEDEQAILELIERSYKYELKIIFGSGGVDADDLNSDVHGEEWRWLKDFYKRRFAGGMEAVLKGKIEPVELPVALGNPLPAKSELKESEDFLLYSDANWNLPCLLELLCPLDKAVVDQLAGLTVQKADQVTEVYWQFDGTAWVKKTRNRGAFSKADEKIIGLKKAWPCSLAAESIVHEVRHQNQPDDLKPLDEEIDAYTFEEEWSIKRGLPGRAKFRERSPSGETIANKGAIETHVKQRYSGAAAGSPSDRVIGHEGTDQAIVQRPDGHEYKRPAVEGESHQDIEKTKANLAGLPKVDPKEWLCPGAKKK